MTGRPLLRAPSISSLMKGSATHASSPHEVRQRLTDWRMGSGRSPQNAQLTSITRSAGRFPNPARAPNPPAANTALSRSVRNLFQIGSFIARSFLLLANPIRDLGWEKGVDARDKPGQGVLGGATPSARRGRRRGRAA